MEERYKFQIQVQNLRIQPIDSTKQWQSRVVNARVERRPEVKK